MQAKTIRPRKEPLAEAIRFDASQECRDYVRDWIGADRVIFAVRNENLHVAEIRTPLGTLVVHEGQWLVKRSDDCYSVLPDEIYQSCYEEV